jgi:hypothetical protein
MHSSDRLYELIHSLTKAEKKYFQLFAKRNSGNNATPKLFNAINTQKHYNEKSLRKKLGYSPEAQSFDVLKHQLYWLIFKSLQAQHLDNTTRNKLTLQVESISFCITRGLKKQASDILQKAKEQAYAIEDFPRQIELLQLEQRLLGMNNYFDSDLAEPRQYYEEVRRILSRIENTEKYRSLLAQIYILGREGESARSESSLKKLQDFMDNELLKDSACALTTFSKVYYYHIHTYYSELIYDNAGRYTNTLEIIRVMEANNAIVKNDPRRYINAMLNGVVASYVVKEYNTAQTLLDRLTAFCKINRHEDSIRWRTMLLDVMLQLTKCIELWKPEDLGSVAELELKVIELEPYTRPLDYVVLQSNLAQTYFGLGNYSQALKWLRKIVSSNDRSIQKTEMYAFSRLLYLVLLYEMKELEFLYHQLKSTYRFLLSRNLNYKFESLLLKFIRNELVNIADHDQLREKLKSFRNQVYALKNDPFENRAFAHFDWISWIDAKIQKRPFIDVARSIPAAE